MLTDVQLGIDPTATPILPGSTEYNLMDRLAEPRADDFPYDEGAVIEGDPDDPSRVFKYVRETLTDSLQRWKDSPFCATSRWKVSVPTKDSGTREFLIGPPFYYCNKPDVDARNGRVYVAIDCATEKFVFLKDVWRFKDVDHVSEREGLVLKRLNEAGVPYVPTLLCDAELPDQRTKTSQILKSYQDDEAPPELQHYRMVVSEVCFAMSSWFKTGRQLVSTIRDCVVAHSRAVEVLGRIHCDISPGNIMAYPRLEVSPETGKPTVRWEGMLIDWELNRRLKEDSHVPYRLTLQRTWAFVSHEYLQDRNKVLVISDELESFLYALLYIAVRF
ncbi:hypothetical protein K466DRAFT_631544, partial [Polyporus arcularius HHB13444]